MKLRIVCFLLMTVSINVFAGDVTTTTTISGIYTYGEDTGASQNAIVIKVANTISGCESGFWVSPADSLGNKNIAAFLLSAFHSNSNVYFAAYDDQLLFGNHCKVHSTGLVR